MCPGPLQRPTHQSGDWNGIGIWGRPKNTPMANGIYCLGGCMVPDATWELHMFCRHLGELWRLSHGGHMVYPQAWTVWMMQPKLDNTGDQGWLRTRSWIPKYRVQIARITECFCQRLFRVERCQHMRTLWTPSLTSVHRARQMVWSFYYSKSLTVFCQRGLTSTLWADNIYIYIGFPRFFFDHSD